MYVDLSLLFLIYCFSVIALGVSIYALWTLEEIRQELKSKNRKPNNAWDHYHNKANEKPKAKGYWD
jgi:hypothetical protein